MVGMIASLGKYVPCSNTEPGAQTLWIGLQHIHDFTKSFRSYWPAHSSKIGLIVRYHETFWA